MLVQLRRAKNTTSSFLLPFFLPFLLWREAARHQQPERFTETSCQEAAGLFLHEEQHDSVTLTCASAGRGGCNCAALNMEEKLQCVEAAPRPPTAPTTQPPHPHTPSEAGKQPVHEI